MLLQNKEVIKVRPWILIQQNTKSSLIEFQIQSTLQLPSKKLPHTQFDICVRPDIVHVSTKIQYSTTD